MEYIKEQRRKWWQEDLSSVLTIIRDPQKIYKAAQKSWQNYNDNIKAGDINNRLRQQFIVSLNKSDRSELPHKDVRRLRALTNRNGLGSFLLKPYEIYSRFQWPFKIASALLFIKSSVLLLSSALGGWAIAAPLVILGSSRIGHALKNMQNRRDERYFKDRGYDMPPKITVRKGKAYHGQEEVGPNAQIALPLLHTEKPQWAHARFDEVRTNFTKASILHAFEFELIQQNRAHADIVALQDAFPKNETAKNCAFGLQLLLPDYRTQEIIDIVKLYEAETLKEKTPATKIFKKDKRLTELVLAVMEPLAVQDVGGRGLSNLTHLLDEDNLNFMIKMGKLGHILTKDQGKRLHSMAQDPRFHEHMSFHQLYQMALWPEQNYKIFDDLWRESSFRKKFNFEAARDIINNLSEWGKTALVITNHDYAQDLNAEEIFELASPENEHWAQIYHDIRSSQTCDTEGVGHTELREQIKRSGRLAIQHYTKQSVRQ